MVEFLEDLKTCLADEDVEGLCNHLQRVPGLPDGLRKLNTISADIMSFAARKGHVHLFETLSQLGVDICSNQNNVVSSAVLFCS